MIRIALPIALLTAAPAGAFDPQPAPPRTELMHTGVQQLVALQQPNGAWPYEGVYRVDGEIPIGYRVGGTALACEALMGSAWPDDAVARGAFDRGIAFLFKALKDPRMAVSTENRYDVRVWGQTYALDLFCHLLSRRPDDPRAAELNTWIRTLTAALIAEELPDGGWNYANRRRHAAFVTAPVLQALLQARARGATVPETVLLRGGEVLRASAVENGAFHYSGKATDTRRGGNRASAAGSAARSALCEATLMLLGRGSVSTLRNAINNFHLHWHELEARRKKTGTHVGPHGIAPYYFYFGHRYTAQAIELLPPAMRTAERDKLLAKLLRTRDHEGTWNDRVFPRSRNYGTAMAILALLQDQAPLPLRIQRAATTTQPAAAGTP